MKAATVAISLLFVTNASAAEPKERLQDDIYLSPQHLVAVDGMRRINLICVGNGKPAVILNSGLGGGSMFWRHVQSEIATFTQVCTYDRAGYGFSDPATRASDATNTVDDLHRLIHAAGLPIPIVYVGHSAAGLYGVLFAASYPQELAGMILIDPSFAHQERLLAAPLTAAQRETSDANRKKLINDAKHCLSLAGSGDLTPPKTKTAADCLDTSSDPEKLDEALTQEERRQWSLPATNAAALSEFSSFLPITGEDGLDSAELDGATTHLGDKPLVILTAGKEALSPPGASRAQQEAIASAWNAGHEVLAKLSSRGSNRLVPGAGHYIQIDKPAIVIEAVQTVVTGLRN